MNGSKYVLSLSEQVSCRKFGFGFSFRIGRRLALLLGGMFRNETKSLKPMLPMSF